MGRAIGYHGQDLATLANLGARTTPDDLGLTTNRPGSGTTSGTSENLEKACETWLDVSPPPWLDGAIANDARKQKPKAETRPDGHDD